MAKLTAPKDAGEYFRRTEHAVRNSYAGLDSCWMHYERALQHWDISQIGQPMTPERKARLDKYLELAGKILRPRVFRLDVRRRHPPGCLHGHQTLFTQHHHLPFCIGRELHGIPTGLIVYAGRNQYAHWDDEQPRDVTRNVFGALSDAFYHNALADLAFRLSNPTINVYATEVLLVALGWKSYDTYMSEMTSLLT